MEIWRAYCGIIDTTYPKYFTSKELAEKYMLQQVKYLIDNEYNFKSHSNGGQEFMPVVEFSLDSYICYSDENGLKVDEVTDDESDNDSDSE